MLITFNPPIGETLHIRTSSLLPQTQTTPLLFTAQLGAHDHEQLIRDGGRVQLWSNLPHDENFNGAWGELEFLDSAHKAPRPLGAYTVSLGGSLPIYDAQERILYLPISLPIDDSWTRRFSFTYRIAYPSGDIIWLGAFGQNGTLVLEQVESNLLDGLVLQDGWSTDHSRRARIFQVEENLDSLEVAKVEKMTDYRIWALGKDSFLPDSKNASVVFFVPRSQQHSLALHATYVMTASPGQSVTISTEGRITVSGSGTLLLQVNDMKSEADQFIREILQHSKLDAWNILASDSRSKVVVLSSNPSHHPISAAVIPLWPSQHLDSSLRLELAKLSRAFGTDDLITEFALFSSYNLQVHVFSQENRESGSPEDIILEYDPLHSDFLLSPIRRLRTARTGHRIKRTWAAAILSPYTIVPSPFSSEDVLPTPPPSPHLQPIARLSNSSGASVDTTISSVPSLPSDTGISSQNHSAEQDSNPAESSQAVSADDGSPPLTTAAKRAQAQPPTPSAIHSFFRSIFASVTMFLRVVYHFFWSRLRPTRDERAPSPETEDEQNSDIEGTNNFFTGIDHDPQEIDPILPPTTIAVESTQALNIPEMTTVESQGVESGVLQSEDPVSSGILRAPDRSTAGEGVCYAELHYNTQDMISKRTTAAILLMPCPSPTAFENSAEDDGPNGATPVPSLTELEAAVQFIDGSGPECAVSKCDVFRHDVVSAEDRGKKQDRDSCYLLEYQLDWEDTKKDRVISISSPVVV